MKDAVLDGFRNWRDFRGRSGRPQFWWWILFAMIGGIPFAIADQVLLPDLKPQGPLAMFFDLLVLVPSLAVTTRRLHDIGRTGWWQAAWMIPGALVLAWLFGLFDHPGLMIAAGLSLFAVLVWSLIWMSRRGDTLANNYGLPP